MAYKDKEKERQTKKKYYQKNKEKILKRTRAYNKQWYQRNKEKVQLQHQEYYQKNKEKVREYHKKWYQENRERMSRQSKKYYQENKEKVLSRHRKYNKKNIERLLEYKRGWQKWKRKIDPKYRLDENMGSAIARSLKDKKAKRPWEVLVNYTLEELIRHLEKQFDNRMSWDNYGSYWVVDHVKPKSLFSYISPNDLEFKKCWALGNLQPLEKRKNIKKKNHLTNF